jgi:hypothetical protein
MEYLWDLYLVQITIEMAGGKLIFSGQPYLARQLSVRNVVPPITNTSFEIYLSIASAKQYDDTDFILVPAMGRTSSRGALKVLYYNAGQPGAQTRN